MLRGIALLFLLGWAAAATYQVSGETLYEARAPLGAFRGVNPTLEGQVVFKLTKGFLQGRVCLDLSAWDSTEPLRDRHTREMFQVDRYPRACLNIQGFDPGQSLVQGTLATRSTSREPLRRMRPLKSACLRARALIRARSSSRWKGFTR